MSIDFLTYFPKELLDVAENPLLADAEGDSLYNDLVLSDSDNGLLLSLTLEQYTQLLSSAYEGAISLYPDNWLNVIYPLIKAGKMYICTAIQNCIENDTDTQNALSQWIILSGLIPSQIDPNSTTVPDRLPAATMLDQITPLPDCDKDQLWGMCLEIATRLDGMGSDFLQELQVVQDKAERLIRLVDMIPLVGTVLANTMLAVVDNAEDLYNGYIAHSSQAVIEDLACQIFNLVCWECKNPSYSDVITIYSNAGITGVQGWINLTYQAFVDYLVGSSVLANSVIYFTTISFQLYTLYLDSVVLGNRGYKTIELWGMLGMDNPSTDWQLLCDPCSAPTYNWNYATDPTGWIPPTGWQLVSSHPVGNYSGYLDGYGTYIGGAGYNTIPIVLEFTVPSKNIASLSLSLNRNGTPTQIQSCRVQAGTFDQTQNMSSHQQTKNYAINQVVSSVTVTFTVRQTYAGATISAFTFALQ